MFWNYFSCVDTYIGVLHACLFTKEYMEYLCQKKSLKIGFIAVKFGQKYSIGACIKQVEIYIIFLKLVNDSCILLFVGS